MNPQNDDHADLALEGNGHGSEDRLSVSARSRHIGHQRIAAL
jgi:hypothetical protein